MQHYHRVGLDPADFLNQPVVAFGHINMLASITFRFKRARQPGKNNRDRGRPGQGYGFFYQLLVRLFLILDLAVTRAVADFSGISQPVLQFFQGTIQPGRPNIGTARALVARFLGKSAEYRHLFPLELYPVKG